MPETEKILIAHGGGGTLTHELIRKRILSRLGNPALDPLMDGALLSPNAETICMTTDAYVVQPIQFPGADIGRLSVCGTVNDLAVMGAKPLGISLAMVLEEGLSLALFDTILNSIAAASEEANVPIITGDTKVVERGGINKMVITTAGIGSLPQGLTLGFDAIKPDDVIMINGPVGEHGLAVMSAREGFAFQTTINSDAAPLNDLIERVRIDCPGLKFMRDPTRAGVAGVLVDICEETGLSVEIDERKIPVTPVCKHTAEMLGLDPLIIANEGKVIMVLAPEEAEKALRLSRESKYGKRATIIGRITEAAPALVELVTIAGGRRIIQRPYGEELPRIC